jgi:hypothetical protein
LGANPGNFLRGDGIAKEDVRDVGQEMYLQHVQKMSRQQQQQQQQEGNEESKRDGHQEDSSSTLSPQQTSPSTSHQNGASPEMPADLLKFIQDVGPADKQVDRDFTAPRLLEPENLGELEKTQGKRTTRQRRRMPLMGQDERFTTEKNTYFSYSEEESALGARSVVPSKEFGLSNLELYDLLRPREEQNDTTVDGIVDAFCNSKMTEIKQQGWTDEETEQHKEWLRRTMESIEIPTLRMDSEGNMLGLYSKDVPGPEVKSVSVIPESKVMLVLKDLAQSKDGIAMEGSATDKLMERRKERKARSG